MNRRGFVFCPKAAVHKQKFVHRDIKPGNIMVSLEEGGAPIAKIIDLGLAKVVNGCSGWCEINSGLTP